MYNYVWPWISMVENAKLKKEKGLSLSLSLY